MLSAENLVVGFGRTTVLRNVTFNIPAGSFAVLLGRNGAGKTTMLRSIMGLLHPQEGAIDFEGQSLASVASYRRADLGMGYMPEDRRLMPHWTVRDNLSLARWTSRRRDSLVPMSQILEFIPELAPMLDRAAGKLSGGQQKLVALGRALMVGHKLLLLDEPFEGVAPVLATRLLEILRVAVRGGKQTVLLTESDRSLSDRLRTHVFALERGILTVH